MKKRAAMAVGMALMMAACSRTDAVRNGVATDEGIAAIALPERQLRTFLVGSGLGTTSGPMFIYQLGSERGCAVLGQAVDEGVKANLPAWRANLIASYRENVPADELARAVQRGPGGAQHQLKGYLSAIGRDMKSKSEELLRQASVQVLTRMGDEAAKIEPSTIDRAARERELREIQKTKRVCKDVVDRAQSVNA